MIKVIHVEDDDDIRELVGLSLDATGDFELLSFASGVDALRAVEVFGPDLLLLDMMMPNMNGIETLEAIRKMEGYSKIPAIFLTARASVNQNEELLDAGALDVIVKPFDPLELGREVKQLLSGASVSS